VIVATTAMLTFISFWRAAAVVLNDLASSAYYAGGIAEQTIDEVAPLVRFGGHAYALHRAVSLHRELWVFVRGGVMVK
jgi:hypothetical protein